MAWRIGPRASPRRGEHATGMAWYSPRGAVYGHHTEKVTPMLPPLVLLVGAMLGALWGGATAAQEPQAARQAIAHAFAGTHQFSYLFVENGVPYLDHPAHVQVVETEEDPEQQTTQIAFYNQTGDGKRLHFRYVLQGQASHITLREFDARGTHRFDCVGTYQPETRLLQCTALNAPKPAGISILR